MGYVMEIILAIGLCNCVFFVPSDLIETLLCCSLLLLPFMLEFIVLRISLDCLYIWFFLMCRRYCTARLRRLYKSLKFTHGRGKYTKRAITQSTVSEVRFAPFDNSFQGKSSFWFFTYLVFHLRFKVVSFCYCLEKMLHSRSCLLCHWSFPLIYTDSYEVGRKKRKKKKMIKW